MSSQQSAVQSRSSAAVAAPAAAPSAAVSAPAVAAPSAQPQQGQGELSVSNFYYPLPSDRTLQFAFKLSVIHDKPVMFDYWIASLGGQAIIGTKEGSKDRLLVKSEEEYTSLLVNIYKSEPEYILITENSIYIVSNKIQSRRVNF